MACGALIQLAIVDRISEEFERTFAKDRTTWLRYTMYAAVMVGGFFMSLLAYWA